MLLEPEIKLQKLSEKIINATNRQVLQSIENINTKCKIYCIMFTYTPYIYIKNEKYNKYFIFIVQESTEQRSKRNCFSIRRIVNKKDKLKVKKTTGNKN